METQSRCFPAWCTAVIKMSKSSGNLQCLKWVLIERMSEWPLCLCLRWCSTECLLCSTCLYSMYKKPCNKNGDFHVWLRCNAQMIHMLVSMNFLGWLLPEHDYVTFGSLLLQIRLSSLCLCNVRAPYSG